MTQFRPCIDLHQGQVKQIVGGSLNNQGAKTNFVSEKAATFYAELYKKNNLTGGHVISLGPGNDTQAKAALGAYPDGLQYGGGITPGNAKSYLEAGASHVIVTSYIFDDEKLNLEKVRQLQKIVGKNQLVLDLSCRRVKSGWFIATNRWQTITETEINEQTLNTLSQYCDEFLVHAADVEGLQQGIDEDLVRTLSQLTDIPITYAGGARSLKDLEHVKNVSKGKIDLTIGSALDIFGGDGVTLDACITFNNGAR